MKIRGIGDWREEVFEWAYWLLLSLTTLATGVILFLLTMVGFPNGWLFGGIMIAVGLISYKRYKEIDQSIKGKSV